jgi:hypothetical protein
MLGAEEALEDSLGDRDGGVDTVGLALANGVGAELGPLLRTGLGGLLGKALGD